MVSSFIVVPQWQGSGSSRAMQLAEGAQAILGDLPPASTTLVSVPLGAGSDQGSGVQRLTAIQLVRNEVAAALNTVATPSIVIGGDCGIALAAVEHATDGRSVVVIWLDAHADLNTPESSPSGAFSGMVLRTLLGDGTASLLPTSPLVPERVVLAGVRALDDAEAEYIASAGIRLIDADALTPAALVEAIEASGAEQVYLHIDLDVIDPGEFGGLGFPEPFGLSASALIELIRTARATRPLAGAAIAGFAPSSTEQAGEDLPTILRIIGALTA